jgi:hypothetical protein
MSEYLLLTGVEMKSKTVVFIPARDLCFLSEIPFIVQVAIPLLMFGETKRKQ